MKRKPINPELVRDRLSVAQGKRYWQTLDELAADPAVRELVEREFPAGAAEWTDPVSRRRFLALMGASLGLAGLAGCRAPSGTILPYVHQPENLVPGKPLYYATAMTLAGFATGLLVESHEGRPTKIEGNPDHPASRGATSATHQAAILGLYDPDRSRSVKFRSQPRELGAALDELRDRLSRSHGRGVAVLSEIIGSPTLLWQKDQFESAYPEARWFQYEAVHRDNVHAGARLAFGQAYHSFFDLTRADVVVSLDCDFLGQGPTQLPDARAFASRRRQDPEKAAPAVGGPRRMNRLYVFESDLTITGAKADHRLAVRPSRVEAIARALAARLGVAGAAAPGLEQEEERYVRAVIDDLRARKPGSTLVRAGDGQPPAVHAIAHAINERLGNFGRTVLFTEPLPSSRHSSLAGLDALMRAIRAGEVHTLLILDGNPVATAPATLPLGAELKSQLRRDRKEWMAFHLGQYFDETARLCHWHIPQSHFLEQWGDGVAFDGTVSITQPLIAPLYDSRSTHEILASLTPRSSEPGDYDSRSGMELVQAYWRTNRSGGGGSFDDFWQKTLNDGVMAGTRASMLVPTLAAGLMGEGEMRPGEEGGGKAYELSIVPDPLLGDGRFANNGWLQETPRPITRLTWDNALLMSPATAKELGVGTRLGNWNGGERGESIADVVTVEHGGRRLAVAVWVVPGHADNAFTLHMGYGRNGLAGNVAKNVGFDANRLRDARPAWFLTGVKVTRAKRTHVLACLQGERTMDGRDVVRSGTLTQYRAKPRFVQEHDEAHGAAPKSESAGERRKSLPTLLPDEQFRYTGYRWGMAIDLSTCIGCQSCVVACQSENNVPVVGKEETTRGRQMQWLRIDRYFESQADRDGSQHKKEPERQPVPVPVDELRVHFQPVLCQHCETAPCELVCPVEATVHGDEGTNDMVYNRCVGTRYCSNNCPYKVRRFNFLQYSDYDTPSRKLGYNPDVTVRTRGVMEKCTFCIQRIATVRIESAKELLDEQDQIERTGKPWPEDRTRIDANGENGASRIDQGKHVAYIHDGEVRTACQAACPTDAIIFGDLNDKKSLVHKLHESNLRYDLLGELGTRPRVGYLAGLRNPNPALEKE